MIGPSIDLHNRWPGTGINLIKSGLKSSGLFHSLLDFLVFCAQESEKTSKRHETAKHKAREMTAKAVPRTKRLVRIDWGLVLGDQYHAKLPWPSLT